MSNLKNSTALLDEWFSLNVALDTVPLCNNDFDSITFFCQIVRDILHKFGSSNEQYIFHLIIYKLDEDIIIPKCFAQYGDSIEELLHDLLTSYDDFEKRDAESQEDEDSDDDDFDDIIGFPFENFTPGEFIAVKADNSGEKDLPLWKIKDRTTVQRYFPFEKKGKTLYRSSTIFAYLSFRNRDKYLAVRVAFILQSKEEIIVEIINDDTVSISAPSFSPPASMTYSALSTKTNELESELPVLKESSINKNAPDDYQRLKIEEYDKQRKNLTLKCTPTYSHILHHERHIVTDDISI